MSKWILIADGAQATVVKYTNRHDALEVLPGGKISYTNIPTRQLTSTKRGRVFNSADGSRSAMERPTDPHDHEKIKFVNELSAFLENNSEHYNALIIFAAPKTLGELRQQLSDPVKQKVVEEIAKDLTNIPINELPKHLQDILPVDAKHKVVVHDER